MSKGQSGRIVIEIDPRVKQSLYAALDFEGSTLKDWFLRQAESYILSRPGAKKPAKTRA